MGQGYQGSYTDLIQVIQARLGNTPTRLPYTPNWEGVRKAILDSSGSGTPRAGDPPDAIQGVIEAIVDKYGVSGTQNLTNLYPPSPKGVLEAFRQSLSLGGGGENPSLEGIVALLLRYSSTPPSYTNTETTTYKNDVTSNGGVVSDPTLAALDTFISSAKTNGYWTQFRLVLPFLGNNLAAALTPLVNGDNVTITNNNFVNGDFSQTSGLNSGLTNTKYLDLGWNPFTRLLDANSSHISCYLMNDFSSSNTYPIALAANAGGNRFGLQIRDSTNFSYFDSYAVPGDRVTSAAATAIGLWTGSRTAINNSALYKGQTVQASNTNNRSGGIPNSNLLAFTYNSGDTNGFEQRRISFITVGYGLSASNVSNYAQDLATFYAAIGR